MLEMTGCEVKGSLAFDTFFSMCVDALACVYIEKSDDNLGCHFSNACHLFLFETGSLIGPELCPTGSSRQAPGTVLSPPP